MNLKNAQTKKTIFYAITFVLICVLVFFSAYYFSIKRALHNYEKTVLLQISYINKTNDSTSKFTKGQTIDTFKVINELPSTIDSLKSYKNSIENALIFEKYKNDNNHLIQGLNNNIDLYEQILLACKSPENPNLKNILTQVQKYKDNCMNDYSLVYIKNSEITLSNDCLDFINNSIFFIEKQVRNNLNKAIYNTENKDFFKTFDEIIESFNIINKDFSHNIPKTKEDTALYDELITSINNVQTSLKGLKSTLSNIKVPKQHANTYNSFMQILEDYNVYVQDIKYTIKTEQLAPLQENTNATISKLYESSNKKFDQFKIDYSKFLEEYSQLKNCDF